MERIDYATIPQKRCRNLTSTRRRHSGVGNNEFDILVVVFLVLPATVERIDANDTANAIGRFNLADTRYSRSATGNQSQGYR